MKFLDIAKYISAIGIIGAATLFFDAKADKSLENDRIIMDNQADLKQDIEHISTEQSAQSERIDGLYDTLAGFEAEHLEQGKDIRSITWILEHQEQFSTEELKEIMDEMLKKNATLTPWEEEWPWWMTVQPELNLYQ